MLRTGTLTIISVADATLIFAMKNRVVAAAWSQIKRKLKAMNGTPKSKLPSYLDKFNWRKCHPGDPFDNLLADIAEFWPPN